MKAKQTTMGLAVVLLVAGVSLAGPPDDFLRSDGNNWSATGGGDFYRICWLYWTDPDDPELWLAEYKIPEVSYSFTAGATGVAQAVRLMFGNSDNCDDQPNITVSIQTDDGNGNPSGTVVGSAWNGGIGYWNGSRWRTAGTRDFPVGTANLIAGQVYHVRLACHNLRPMEGGAGGEAGGAVDFRLYSSDSWNEGSSGTFPDPPPGEWEWDKYKTRSYDGTIDESMYGRYLDDTNPGNPQWRFGAAGTWPYDPNNPRTFEDYKLKSPLFEMYWLAMPDPAQDTGFVGIAPMEQFGQGYRPGGSTTRTFNSDNTSTGATGESFVAHSPHAEPVARKVRIFGRKIMEGGVWDPDQGQWTELPGNPDQPLIVELRDNSNNCIAKAEIDPNAFPWDETSGSLTGGQGWVEAELTDPNGGPVGLSAPLVNSTRYRLVVRTDSLTMGQYQVWAHESRGVVPEDSTNTYRGSEAYLMDSADGGQTFSLDFLRDLFHSLAVIIPGDVNGDQLVNVADLGVLGANYKQSGMDWQDGDFNGDGLVNVADLGVLGGHYKQHLPEPASAALLGLGGLVLLARRRRRSRLA